MKNVRSEQLETFQYDSPEESMQHQSEMERKGWVLRYQRGLESVYGKVMTESQEVPPRNPNKRTPNIKMKRSLARNNQRDRVALWRANGGFR